jgi:ubiquinone/menaquinone biosynthesis C-methylase UbiE
MDFDKESVALARRAIADAGLDHRVEVQQTDANELSVENTYDLITMNLVLHETGGPAEYRNVLNRVRRALKPGGIVVVSELPYPDSPYAYRQNPIYKKLAGLQIHEAIVGCGMITQSELSRYLEETGFTNVRVVDQPQTSRFVMIGEKTG